VHVSRRRERRRRERILTVENMAEDRWLQYIILYYKKSTLGAAILVPN
jgi:hypothetical protein